ncbi:MULTISPECIES: glutaredoxin domain-containing protein [unclassified Cryobacterium]|uniref:glutaredoxin domain-containing protein n=1 Tax=unclassified Cryobacterium TaxID=2649013 RepID=UPI002AB42F6F|nr:MULTISPECIES: glutaredoxin domain-containing protein [unclassified Cryobacterium]MDY7543029.1 glutaredoxin domain-containing protein [Cryobacterium sp. 5B3]MEB0000366.1 glutaredoxin domain-containing protein [Cryobacterium sp. RTS3]MEB0266080.1 glutaredoxin domain-containing protein [Cryobacterium sp. 10I5]MEB0274028.1 glutaredoxin domain-containing protein [Cryobacterium sp. 5B3]
MTDTVTVYSKPGCVQCAATVRKLTQLGIDFTLIDVTQDPVALEYVTGLGHIQAPVVETPGASWSGYRPDLINALRTSLDLVESAAEATTAQPQ